MNDYPFGNRLYELRRTAGLTQREVARRVGVSDKAVSKWETGASKPTTDALRSLAALYGVPVGDLLAQREAGREPSVTKIVVTGGPCAGKTTAMSWIQNAFGERGYAVLFVPETATELITGGVAPWTCGSNAEYQRCQLDLQMAKEKVFQEAARTMPQDKVLMVCDRGTMDNKAYMSDLDFAKVLRDLGQTEVGLRDTYDAVFHLTTAAKGAVEAYTLSNNAARTETPDEAAALDDRLIAAWTGHPHLRVVDNSTSFDEKMRRLVAEIASFLGEPEPLEVERKYLIEYPDIAWLESLPNCRRVEIIQTYLTSADPDEEVRVRQRGTDGSYTYYKTSKRRVSGVARVEVERRLSEREYLDLLMSADTSRRQIRKTRYCLATEAHYLEIDVYPFWDDRAILEVELRTEDEKVVLPREFRVIREVTEDDEYKNANLARA